VDYSNPILVKSKQFALLCVQIYKELTQEHREYVLSKQLLRSGTSIGANVREAVRGLSKADFYARLNIALKEASETEYWLEILSESGYLEQAQFTQAHTACNELIRLLVSITKTQKTGT